MSEAGWDETWIDNDDFKVGCGTTLVPYFKGGSE
jgi:hypothetical protein